MSLQQQSYGCDENRDESEKDTQGVGNRLEL